MTDINNLLDSFQDYTILIIGDVMIDSYIWGKVTRISPEAPVPVVTRNNSEYRLGGAANVVKNIQAMKATPILCSVIGHDEYGSLFKGLLKSNNLTDKGLIEDKSRITTAKTRIISGSQHLLRVDHEQTDYIRPDLENQLFSRIRDIIRSNPVHAIIFQDYDKGIITPHLIDEISSLANKHGIHTLVDPKKRNFLLYHDVTLFKPNLKELAEGLNLVDIDKEDTETLYDAARSIHEERNIQYVMVTLAEKGILISHNNHYHVVPAEIRDIADVSGAGDTVISMAALCLAAGLSPRQTTYLSNLAGGLVCEKVGVVPVTPEMLLKFNIDFTGL